MNATKRWVVRPSGFPFGAPGQQLGTVNAPDRTAALTLAESIYGALVTVEPETNAKPMNGAPVVPAHAALGLTSASAMRRMTAIEVQMARAVGCLRFPPPQHKGTIRRLHAESFKPAPEISDDLSLKLRAIVQVLASQLPRELVESVGGGA